MADAARLDPDQGLPGPGIGHQDRRDLDRSALFRARSRPARCPSSAHPPTHTRPARPARPRHLSSILITYQTGAPGPRARAKACRPGSTPSALGELPMALPPLPSGAAGTAPPRPWTRARGAVAGAPPRRRAPPRPELRRPRIARPGRAAGRAADHVPEGGERWRRPLPTPRVAPATTCPAPPTVAPRPDRTPLVIVLTGPSGPVAGPACPPLAVASPAGAAAAPSRTTPLRRPAPRRTGRPGAPRHPADRGQWRGGRAQRAGAAGHADVGAMIPRRAAQRPQRRAARPRWTAGRVRRGRR